MSHGQQNSTIPTFKLSPNVAAFVPGVSYTPSSPPASSNHVTSNSNLSPLVPEFYPSVLYDHTAAPPYKAAHASGYHEDTTADFQHETPVQQQYQQKKLASSSKKTKAKSEKLINESKGEESSTPGEQTLSTSTRTQKTSKAKSKRGKKGGIEVTNPHQNQKALNEGSSGGGRQATGVLKDDFSSKICENLNGVSYRENAQKKQGDPGLEQSSGAQKVKLNPQSKEGASLSEKSSLRSTFTDKEKHTADEVEERHHASAKTLDTGHHIAPTFAVSYSDKVKSLATCNKTQNDNLSSDTSKSWVKDFSPSYSKDVKHRPVQESCGIGDRKYNSTVLDHSSKRGAKTVRTGTTSDRTKQSSEKTQNAMDKSKYRELKDGCSRVELHAGASSHSNLHQFTQRTGRTKESCDHFKKMSCDNDVNWRQRQDDSNTSHFGELDRKEQLRKVDSKEHNTNFPTKRNSHPAAQDSNKQETQVDHKHVKPFHHHSPAMEEKKPAHKEQYSSKASLNSSVDVHSNMKPDNRTRNPPEPFKETRSSSATPYKSKELSWDFPDLTDSVKMKKNSGNEIRAANVEERADVFFTRHVTPLSYSAALKSAPQPRAIPVSPFNEGRHPSAQRGLLKVPHPNRSEDENEDKQEETKGKKKKKKKKKKNKDGKEKAAEGGSPRRTERGIAFDLGEMLQTITVQHGNSPERKQSGKKVVVATGVLPTQLSATSPTETNPSVKVAFTWKKEEQSNFKSPHNTLDSTAPVIKRGKERETPARKKPSALKKIILKEREEKKKAREPKDETCEEGDENGACVAEDENVVQPEEEVETSVTEDSSGLTLSDDVEPSPMDQQIAAEIHSRRFREYCFQVPDKEVDAVATELLKELVRFQDRQFHKDPVKAKAKRRFVLGLREVNKHLKLRKLKCVIISSNVERIKSAGGLDDTLSTIISVCQENKVPLVFALKRQVLGKVLCKKVPVSIVGIFNYDGAQEHFKSLIELTEKTRQAYTEKWQETREKLQSREKEAVDSGTFETTDEGHETGKSLVSEETLDELKTVDGSYPADSDNSGGEEDDDDDDKDVIIEDDLEIVNVESTEYFDNQD